MSPKYWLLSCIALISSFYFAYAEDPYKYFDWHVNYGHVYPLGVQQRGILINNQFPGPDIISVTNDNLIINVHNHLDEPFLISWRDSDMACWVLQKAEKLCAEHDVKVEGRVEEGDPGDVICEMVKVLKADLLVTGSHGYGQLTRAILKSVSHHCVQNAGCPVLVVKMPK